MRCSVLALAAAGLGLAAAPALAKTTTLPAAKVKVTKASVVDLAPAGDSLGDLQTFSYEVFDAKTGKKTGAGHGYCVRVAVGVASTCLNQTDFANGTLLAQWNARDGRLTDPIHFTGGSGTYFGGVGAGKITGDANDPTSFTVTGKIKK